MTIVETIAWDPSEHLNSEEEIDAYLEAATEENDETVMAAALDDVDRANHRLRKENEIQ